MLGRPLHILVVEDDDDVDAEFLIRGFRRNKSQHAITFVRDGIEALTLLRSRDRDPAEHAYLIFTDINMPGMNGIEFIRELRQDSQLAQLVVFVLTGSALAMDILAAYNLQIAGYLLKVSVTENFSTLVKLVECYQRFVEFPP